MKRFSIIVVTKDNASGVKRTLESISSLDYPEYDVIVIDGGSVDGTGDVVSGFAPLVGTYVSEPDSGIYNAMNRGMQYAAGEYTVFMNSGDCFAGADVLSYVSQFDSDIILGASEYGGKKRLPPETVGLYSLLSEGICHQSTYYRTELLRRYPFDERLSITADLKSVVEPYCREKASVVSSDRLLSICEGGGVSKSRWRDICREKEMIVKDCVDPFYAGDYLRFCRISAGMFGDFSVISHFSSLSPLVRLISECALQLNKLYKHLPIQ